MTKKLSIEDMQEYAKSRGLRCLSNSYKDSKTKLLWGDKHKHTWLASSNNIKQGGGCPICANKSRQEKKRTPFSVYKKLIENKGGSCLSTACKNSNNKLHIRCANNHEWWAFGTNLKRGHWCQKCMRENNKTSFEVYKKIIYDKGGVCISHHNDRLAELDKITIRCANGHEWTTLGQTIKIGHWCPECQRTPFDMYKEIIKTKGGICLSTSCPNSMVDKIFIRCAKGHEWMVIGDSLKRGSWCPECGVHRNEIICRKYFERFLGKKFIKIKPQWLKGPTGRLLELDGYCKELNLAFEYNGKQHYEKIKHFGGKIKFEKIKQHDILKKELCTANGIDLIEIPYTISNKELGSYILAQCKQRDLKIINSDVGPVHGVYAQYGELDKQIIQTILTNIEICNRDIARSVNQNAALVSVHLNHLVEGGILTKKQRMGEPISETHKNPWDTSKSYIRSTPHMLVYYKLAENNKEVAQEEVDTNASNQ